MAVPGVLLRSLKGNYFTTQMFGPVTSRSWHHGRTQPTAMPFPQMNYLYQYPIALIQSNPNQKDAGEAKCRCDPLRLSLFCIGSDQHKSGAIGSRIVSNAKKAKEL